MTILTANISPSSRAALSHEIEQCPPATLRLILNTLCDQNADVAQALHRALCIDKWPVPPIPSTSAVIDLTEGPDSDKDKSVAIGKKRSAPSDFSNVAKKMKSVGTIATTSTSWRDRFVHCVNCYELYDVVENGKEKNANPLPASFPSHSPSPPGGPKPTDPLMRMLASRAAADVHFKELMKAVASQTASPDQLREFQAQIREFSTRAAGSPHTSGSAGRDEKSADEEDSRDHEDSSSNSSSCSNIRNGNCVYHNGYLEIDEDSTAWIDHDEGSHGPIGTSEQEIDTPWAFIWTCCEKFGNEEGCKKEYHEADGDLESYAKWRRAGGKPHPKPLWA